MGAVSFTLISNVGPCRAMSMIMFDEHMIVPTYIIGDCGNVLEAREEADLVRTGIFVGYTELMLVSPEFAGDKEVLTMGTCIRPGQRNAPLDKI